MMFLYRKAISYVQHDVTSRTAWSFVNSISIVANVWIIAHDKARVREKESDETASCDIKYSKTSNRVYIILLFRGSASHAFEASTPRCIWVANRRIFFSYKRIENICRHADQQNPCPRIVERYPCVSQFYTDFCLFIVILLSSLMYDNTAQYINWKYCRDT